MYAIKGGLVGKTFALAKGNESGGRKSRIRRSKEERKGMAETFIKKYQHLNNGSFPSLSLTHKEVGGSFYTVREIVREIIQENRVLGPAKFLQEEQSDDLLDQFPVGTISTEPQTPFLMLPNGSAFVPDQPEITSEEFDLACAESKQEGVDNRENVNVNHVPNGSSLVPDQSESTREKSALVYAEPEQQKNENGEIINGSRVFSTNEEPAEETVSELQVIGSLETEKSGKVASSDELSKLIETEKTTEVAASGKPNVLEVQVSEPLERENNDEKVVVAAAGEPVELAVDQPETTAEEFDLLSAKLEQQGVDDRETVNVNHVLNESPLVPDQCESTMEKSALVSTEPEQLKFDNGEIINGNHAFSNNEEPGEQTVAELQMSESLETEKNVKEAASSQLNSVGVQLREPLETEEIAEVTASGESNVQEVQVSEPLETEKDVVEVVASAGKAVEVQVSEPLETEKNVVEVVASAGKSVEVQEKKPIEAEENVKKEVTTAGKSVELQASKALETEKTVSKVAGSKDRASRLTDVVVETFPLRPISLTTDNYDGKSGEASHVNDSSTTTKENLEKGHSGPGNGISLPDRVTLSETSSLQDNKEAEKPHPLLGTPSSPTTDGGIAQDNGFDTNADKKDIQKPISETKVVNAPNGSISSGKSKIPQDHEKRTQVQCNSGSNKGGNPTLNRIKLESWEQTNKQPPKQETNPLFAVIKSFIAFVKFWTE